jgi:hypothetical protein
MAKTVNYSIEEIAKYNAVSVIGSLQELAGIYLDKKKIQIYYKAMLQDLQTGAMERSCKEYDRVTDNGCERIKK